MESSAKFPNLYHGKPDWPSRDDEHLFWIGLHTQFKFAHHPADWRTEDATATHSAGSAFCAPKHLAEKLKGLITDSHCGSILITGYRGTGKTSLVNLVIEDLRLNKRSEAFRAMATSRSALVRASRPVLPEEIQKLLACCQDIVSRRLAVRQALRTPIVAWLAERWSSEERMLRRLEELILETERVMKEHPQHVEPSTKVVKSLRAILVELEKLVDFDPLTRKRKIRVYCRISNAIERLTQYEQGSSGGDWNTATKVFLKQLQKLVFARLRRRQAGSSQLLRMAMKTCSREERVLRCFLRSIREVRRSLAKLSDKSQLLRLLLPLRTALTESLRFQQSDRKKQMWLHCQLHTLIMDLRAGKRFSQLSSTEIKLNSGAPPPLPHQVREPYLRVDVNLSTVTSAHDVLLLTYEALERELKEHWTSRGILGSHTLHSPATSQEASRILQSLKKDRDTLRASSVVESIANAQGFTRPGSGKAPTDTLAPRQITYSREALSRFQALLAATLREIRDAKTEAAQDLQVTPIFVFDELDKLLPLDPDRPRQAEGTAVGSTPQARKLANLQQIVAELKYFFSQSPSHQIVIAGKDVDDSWSEDQNRGSGLFESIFAANVHVPSIFSTELEPCAFGIGSIISAEVREARNKQECATACPPTPAALGTSPTADPRFTLDEFYEMLARELGIARNSWGYNTALLILPHLAEYETFQLIERIQTRYEKAAKDDSLGKRNHEKLAWLRHLALEICKKLRVQHPDGEPVNWEEAGPMSERSCRRLQTLILYLTYKGRGIPRKILREFYDTILAKNAACKRMDSPGVYKLGLPGTGVKYLIAFPQHHLQKMNFYAGIVGSLDLSYSELRGLNDKGRVSIFHVLDYILKFYSTGFALRDLEHANFMTTREEFFPSRQLALLLIRLLDGRLWRRKDSRNPEYRLLHNVVHDLGVMFLRYGPEQSELRHTQADFRDEIQQLEAVVSGVEEVPPGHRTAPVHAQIRLARIYEITGDHHNARLGYYKALRWLRSDVRLLESNHAQDQWFVPDFLRAPATYLIEVFLAVGRLHEQAGEYPAATQHYHEAERVYCQYRKRMQKSELPQNAITGRLDRTSEWETIVSPDDLLATIAERDQFKPAFENENLGDLVALRRTLQGALSAKYMTPLELPFEISGSGSGLHGIAAGRVETLNHLAVVYAKMWENVSANLHLLKALLHLHLVGDEYGVVDQMFLIGQIMVRRRDFRAAVLWYLSALRNIRSIQKYSDLEGERKLQIQSGAKWQTHTVASGTEAQILAALADVWFATDGSAFLSIETIEELWSNASRFEPHIRSFEYHWNLREKTRQAMRNISAALYPRRETDPSEEFFHTQARHAYQAIGDHLNSNDVYLRRLEVRAETICQAAVLLDRLHEGDERFKQEQQRFLLAWRTFWRGARIAIFRQLSVDRALARSVEEEQGRPISPRRMGAVLRLIGSVMTEISLLRVRGSHRAPRSEPQGYARKILAAQSQYNSNRLEKAALQSRRSYSSGRRLTSTGLLCIYPMELMLRWP